MSAIGRGLQEDVEVVGLITQPGEERPEVAEGVSILSTPGHTPGHQSVVVEAATGELCSRDRRFGSSESLSTSR